MARATLCRMVSIYSKRFTGKSQKKGQWPTATGLGEAPNNPCEHASTRDTTRFCFSFDELLLFTSLQTTFSFFSSCNLGSFQRSENVLVDNYAHHLSHDERILVWLWHYMYPGDEIRSYCPQVGPSSTLISVFANFGASSSMQIHDAALVSSDCGVVWALGAGRA